MSKVDDSIKDFLVHYRGHPDTQETPINIVRLSYALVHKVDYHPKERLTIDGISLLLNEQMKNKVDNIPYYKSFGIYALSQCLPSLDMQRTINANMKVMLKEYFWPVVTTRFDIYDKLPYSTNGLSYMLLASEYSKPYLGIVDKIINWVFNKKLRSIIKDLQQVDGSFPDGGPMVEGYPYSTTHYHHDNGLSYLNNYRIGTSDAYMGMIFVALMRIDGMERIAHRTWEWAVENMKEDQWAFVLLQREPNGYGTPTWLGDCEE